MQGGAQRDRDLALITEDSQTGDSQLDSQVFLIVGLTADDLPDFYGIL